MEFFWIFEIFLGFFFITRGETTLGKVIQEAQANKTWATVDENSSLPPQKKYDVKNLKNAK